MLLKFFAISFAVSVLNDLIWITQPSYEAFVLLDWIIRLGLIGLLGSSPEVRLVGEQRTVTGCGFTYRVKLNHFFKHILLPTFALILIIGAMNKYSAEYPTFRLFIYPEPTSLGLHLADMSFGLFLVAVSETLSFVVLPLLIQRKTGWPLPWVICGACITFGLAHWALGLIQILFTSASHLIIFWVAFRTRSFGSVMLVHFLVDFHHLGVLPLLHADMG